MIVFTDGDDNASVLNANAALARVKKLGIPIYSIAEGEAVTSPALSRGLKEISQVTGGVAYTVKKPKDVETVFQDISEDLQHGYMLTYKPPAGAGLRMAQDSVSAQRSEGLPDARAGRLSAGVSEGKNRQTTKNDGLPHGMLRAKPRWLDVKKVVGYGLWVMLF